MKVFEDIKTIKGIGDKTASLFNKLAVFTIEDLLHYYPRTYRQYDDVCNDLESEVGNVVSIWATVMKDFVFKNMRNINIGSGNISAGKQTVQITFFNSSYFKEKMRTGNAFVFRGKLIYENGRYKMEQPEVYTKEEYDTLRNGIWPVYSLTKGLSNKTVSKAVKTALENGSYAELYEEYLPSKIKSEYELISPGEAIRGVHFPNDFEHLKNSRNRLAFDELFLFLIKLRSLRTNIDETSKFEMIETAGCKRLIERLPYRLTNDQILVWNEIKNDLTSGNVMKRLIQGDVGSGKTIISFLGMLMCIENGYQCALMAPTEILASQHFDKLDKMVKEYNLPIKPALLTGSVSKKEKQRIYDLIEKGEINAVIGTHAIIQESVNFRNLALVITDEQHRFGVNQRQNLKDKGDSPHVLVMSATPIPRTLAMVLYQDMHLSVIKEKPENRIPIKNCVVDKSYRPTAYKFIASQIASGRQAYIVCPMVEESEGLENVENVIDYTQRLREIFSKEIRIEYIHGKMKPSEKSRLMESFYAHNIDVLVSTSVIEVGIDVPNANVMMIENAERFGLSALHQLRGRIGRGSFQSYAIFVNANAKNKNKRLEILNSSNDGFKIAEEDLKLRGAGDVFGIRQSGEFDFEIADIIEDSEMIMRISKTLDDLFTKDPKLDLQDNGNLKTYLLENKDNYIDFATI